MELPDIYPLNGNWINYVDELYSIYLNDVINAGLLFNNLPIKARFKPMTNGKGYGFWHIISDGKEEEERVPDMRRCESLPWISYCILTVKKPPSPISWWKNKRGSDTHIVILHEEKGYVIILAERADYYLLKTAYFPRTRRLEQLKKERDTFWRI